MPEAVSATFLLRSHEEAATSKPADYGMPARAHPVPTPVTAPTTICAPCMKGRDGPVEGEGEVLSSGLSLDPAESLSLSFLIYKAEGWSECPLPGFGGRL